MLSVYDRDDRERAVLRPFLEIAKLVGGKLSLPLLYRRFHEILAREMPAKNLYIAVIEGPESLRFPYFIDEREAEDQLANYPKEGLTAFVIDEGRSIHIGREPKILESVAFVGERPVDWVGIPLRDRDGAVSGILSVQTYKEGEFYDEWDLELLEFAAGQLSIVLELRLYDRNLAISRIATLLDETSDLLELYKGIHGVVSDLIPAAKGCFIIARVDAAAKHFLPVYWRDLHDDWDRIDWPIDRGLSSYIYRVTKSPIIFERGKTKLPAEFLPIGSPPFYWLGVPLWNSREIIGIVIVQSYDSDDPVTREDEAMLSIVGPHIANAINRTELYERTRHGSLR